MGAAGAPSGDAGAGPEPDPGPLAGTYRLVVDHSSKCMDPTGPMTTAMNIAIEQWSCASVSHQRFVLTGAGNGYYTIALSGSSECVGVEGETLEDRAWLVRTPCDGRASQKWLPVPQIDGTYLLVNGLSSKCADVHGQSADNGALVQQFVCNGGDNQLWRLADPL